MTTTRLCAALVASGLTVSCASTESAASGGDDTPEPAHVTGSIIFAVTGNRVAEEPWWVQPPPEPEPPPESVVVEVEISFSGDVLFDVGSYELSPAAGTQLQSILDLARRHPDTQVIIVGHTDSDGTDEANKALSEQRAAAVERWLIEHDIPSHRIDTEGHGEAEPVAPNDTTANKAANRRVAVTVTNQ